AWATDAAGRAQPHPGTAVAGAAQVFARVQKLIALRRATPALIDGAYRELWRQNGAANPNVLAFARGTGAGVRIIALNNGARASGAMRIPVRDLADGTRLVDELDDGAPAQVTITGGVLAVDLPAKAMAIYRIAP
ncbi:MAG: hypothetical protein K8W52_04120, partial [Deltaproteobacteria bacterium]|nr:hypothetical protein [Deltaproteobacteria bacterium]